MKSIQKKTGDRERIALLRETIVAAFTELERMLRTSSYETRMNALEALGAWDRDGLVRCVRKGIHDRDDLVRTTALEVVSDHKLVELKSELMDRLCRDDRRLVRSAAAVAIGDLAIAEARNKLEQRISRVDDEERVRLYYALLKLGQKKYLEPFLAGLVHEYYLVRCATANLVQGICDSSNEKTIRQRVRIALRQETTPAARSSLQSLAKSLR